MSLSSSVWRWVVCVLACAVCVGTARGGAADEISATAQVSATSTYVGDPIVLQITVQGAGSATTPDIVIPGVQAEFAGGQDQSSSMSYSINGRMSQQTTRQYAMQWRLTADKAGRYTIPEISVSAGGQVAKTRPISIVVNEPGESADFKLEMSVEKASAYVGEPVRVKLVWYLGKPAQRASITGNDGGQVYDVFPAPDPRPGGGADDERYPTISLLGSPTRGVLGSGDWDGRQVTTFTQELIVVPKEAGTLKLGPFRATFDAVVGQRKRSFFDFPMDDRSVTQRAAVASKTAEIAVKALPEKGKPADFTGLVGVYGVESSISATEANVGDPLQLSVRITGEEPMAGVVGPDLNKVPGFSDGFRLSPEGWETGKSVPPGARVYSMTVRPQSEEVSEVPAVSLSYFDTKAGEYRRASSKPIALKVKGVKQVTVSDAVGVVPQAAVKVEPLVATAGGVRANVGAGEALVNQRVLGWAWVMQPGTWAVVAGPPMLALSALLAVRRARAGVLPADAALRAIGRAKKKLARARDGKEVGAAVRGAVGGVLGVDGVVVTASDVTRLPKGAEAECRAALLLAERAEFGGEVEGTGGLEGFRTAGVRAVEALEAVVRAGGVAREVGR